MKPHEMAHLPADRRKPLPPLAEDNRVFTVYVDGERFGMPVNCVQTVFRIEAMTPVPLAHAAISGLLNLRGRIVTAISLRLRLGMALSPSEEILAIGIEHRGEAVALLVDEAGDVITLPEGSRISMPGHMPPARARLAHAVHRLDQGLICILDMSAVFDLSQNATLAA